MKTMYPAQANSPGTELAAAIDAIQTTIPLVDASRLPAAPNLMAIGSDDSAETILYTGISGNDLTGVTRGFQGEAKSWVAGSKAARYLTAYDIDSMRKNIESIAKVTPIGTKVSDIVEPFYIAHRGGANIFPEGTIEAYEGCIALGNIMIEQDCRALLDGSLGVYHDTTLDRLTDKTGPASNYSTMAWENIKITKALPGWKETGLTTFEKVLQTFGTRAIYVPESKDQKSAAEIIRLLKKHSLTDHAIVQSFNIAELLPLVDHGVPLMLLVTNTSVLPDSIAQAGIQYVGVSTEVADSYITECIAKGLKVVVWTIDRRYQRDHYLSLGVSGFFSDDPLYLSGKSPSLRKDPFSNQVYFHGTLTPPIDWDSTGVVEIGGRRGEFYEPNYFGFKNVGFRRKDVALQGWAGELPQNFTIETDFTYIAADPTDGAYKTRWCSLAICTPVDIFNDAASYSNGYHILQRIDGRLQIYRIDSGIATLLETFAGSEISFDQTVTISITVSSTDITISRAGEGNVSVADSTYRGGYLHFLTNYLDCLLSNVNIT